MTFKVVSHWKDHGIVGILKGIHETYAVKSTCEEGRCIKFPGVRNHSPTSLKYGRPPLWCEFIHYGTNFYDFIYHLWPSNATVHLDQWVVTMHSSPHLACLRGLPKDIALVAIITRKPQAERKQLSSKRAWTPIEHVVRQREPACCWFFKYTMTRRWLWHHSHKASFVILAH